MWRKRGRSYPPPGEGGHTHDAVFCSCSIHHYPTRDGGAQGKKTLLLERETSQKAIAIMFLFTGSTHFTGMKHDYAAMLPSPLSENLWVIYLTGLLQIAGAVGLLLPQTQRLAGIGLTLLVVAMFPGNVYAALNEVPFRGEPPTPLWLRTPIQLFFLGMVWWSSVRRSSKETRRSRARSVR